MPFVLHPTKTAPSAPSSCNCKPAESGVNRLRFAQFIPNIKEQCMILNLYHNFVL
jgi:hypothetical protein